MLFPLVALAMLAVSPEDACYDESGAEACVKQTGAEACFQPSAWPGRLKIETDRRIELLGVLVRLSRPKSLEEDASASDPRRKAAEERFAPFRNHAAVAQLLKMNSPRSDVNQITSLFYECLDERTLEPRAGSPACAASPLLEALRDFAARSNFLEYCEGEAAAHREDEKQVRAALRSLDPFTVFERYIGTRAPFELTLVPSRLLPWRRMPSWGTEYSTRGQALCTIMQVVTETSFKDGKPVFDVGQVVWWGWNESLDVLRPPLQSLLKGRETLRRRLIREPGCSKYWEECAHDIVRLAAAHELQKEAGLPRQVSHSPLQPLAAALSPSLEGYRKTRKRRKTFESFLPELLSALETLPEIPREPPPAPSH